ncbi:hypothetical protein CPB85DRAFT_540975 [Mucidula mucida]|nr:hypothetical protein CPB85DRAFT_540975 [Mucidula mucida]
MLEADDGASTSLTPRKRTNGTKRKTSCCFLLGFYTSQGEAMDASLEDDDSDDSEGIAIQTLRRWRSLAGWYVLFSFALTQSTSATTCGLHRLPVSCATHDINETMIYTFSLDKTGGSCYSYCDHGGLFPDDCHAHSAMRLRRLVPIHQTPSLLHLTAIDTETALDLLVVRLAFAVLAR